MTLIRDLQFPDESINGKVKVMEYTTGQIIWREPLASDLTWSDLAGTGVHNPYANSSQPFIGCLTRGDMIADHLMEMLTT